MVIAVASLIVFGALFIVAAIFQTAFRIILERWLAEWRSEGSTSACVAFACVFAVVGGAVAGVATLEFTGGTPWMWWVWVGLGTIAGGVGVPWLMYYGSDDRYG